MSMKVVIFLFDFRNFNKVLVKEKKKKKNQKLKENELNKKTKPSLPNKTTLMKGVMFCSIFEILVRFWLKKKIKKIEKTETE